MPTPFGLRCPVHDTNLVDLNGRLYCSHQGHDGRLSGHPDGPAPQTPAFFTLDQAEAGGTTTTRRSQAPRTPETVKGEDLPTPPVTEGSKTCKVCGDTYGVGEYSAHKDKPSHKIHLVVQP